jgi:hypothetical protein
MHVQRGPVRVDRRGADVRVDVLEPELRLESELVVEQQRVGLDHDVTDRSGVVLEARKRDLARVDRASGEVGAFEQTHAQPGLGQVRGGRQTVVACPDEHHVVLVGHDVSLSRRLLQWSDFSRLQRCSTVASAN